MVLTTKKVALGLVLFVVYLISTVPVGLFLYSLKNDMKINVFNETGFHAYMGCLETEAKKAVSTADESDSGQN